MRRSLLTSSTFTLFEMGYQFLKELTMVEEDISKSQKHMTINTSSEEVTFNNSLGRIFAEDIVSGFDVPSFRKSAVEGFVINGINVLPA